MFCSDSNKYNLIIQFIAVLMGIFFTSNVEYLSYLRVILLKVLFSGGTKVIKTSELDFLSATWFASGSSEASTPLFPWNFCNLLSDQ